MSLRVRCAAAAAAILLSAGCAAGETVSANDPGRLRHYDIRADRIPSPGHATAKPSFSIGAPAGARLDLPKGFRISVWAGDGFEQPRGMAVAPNGDVFVADSEAGKVLVLRDSNRDGTADERFVFADGLRQPFGLAFGNGVLYVGNANAVVRFRYTTGMTSAGAAPVRIASVPPGGHWTRNVILSRDGKKLYVAVGSASNVSAGEPPQRAAILEMNTDGSGARIFASGLRNPVGLAWNPASGELWTCVNERDRLGDDVPPDFATSVHDGDFFGWPYAYIGTHEDPRRKGERPDLVRKSRVPDLLIQAHSAPLGMLFYQGSMFPAEYRGDAFVALHGSWDRSELTGFKVIRIPFAGGKPRGGYDDFVVGWDPNPASSRVWGRPVGLAVLPDGSMLISDDGAAKIWRVTYAAR